MSAAPASDYEAVAFEIADRVATITLSRPERMNAFTWQMGAELSDAYARCDADDEVRAIVLTGAGRAFCAGADLGGGRATFESRPQRETSAESAPRAPVMRAFEVRKPVIAAINGHAVGVGLTLSMQCDVRLVAENAKLAFAFVRRGVIPELASHAIVPRVAGLSNAAELMLSGRTFSGREAVDYGIASRALPAELVVPAARELAREIAVNAAPVSVAITKRLLWEGLTRSVDEMAALENPLFAWVGRQSDAAEGVASFVEKRKPEWKLSAAKDLPDWPGG